MTHSLRCRHCKEPVEFGPFRAESLKRFRQFMALAFVIALIGLVLQVIGVPLWPAWSYGTSAFVVLQALLKWQGSRWVMCKGCGSSYAHHGRGDAK